jgi:hypothetical protein
MPPTVVFDLVGTLLDPGALGEPFGAGRELGLAALDDAVAMAMVDTLTGEHRPFPELVRGGLERHVALRDLPREPIDEALDLLRRLPAYPEAGQALGRLRDAGCELATSRTRAGSTAPRARSRTRSATRPTRPRTCSTGTEGPQAARESRGRPPGPYRADQAAKRTRRVASTRRAPLRTESWTARPWSTTSTALPSGRRSATSW